MALYGIEIYTSHRHRTYNLYQTVKVSACEGIDRFLLTYLLETKRHADTPSGNITR